MTPKQEIIAWLKTLTFTMRYPGDVVTAQARCSPSSRGFLVFMTSPEAQAVPLQIQFKEAQRESNGVIQPRTIIIEGQATFDWLARQGINIPADLPQATKSLRSIRKR